jgi:hypothetical protein
LDKPAEPVPEAVLAASSTNSARSSSTQFIIYADIPDWYHPDHGAPLLPSVACQSGDAIVMFMLEGRSAMR